MMTGILKKGLILLNYCRIPDIRLHCLVNGIWDAYPKDLIHFNIYLKGTGKKVNREITTILVFRIKMALSDNMMDM